MEWSYPAMVEGEDGKIHLTYTHARQRIRYASFTEAWIMEGEEILW